MPDNFKNYSIKRNHLPVSESIGSEVKSSDSLNKIHSRELAENDQ